ncbi:D-amino-acid transaminase [Ammoniphilus sp. CFH 90114]|nr:D-amino-acid transaminase [Ammoniphilus sp. CFH 90114]
MSIGFINGRFISIEEEVIPIDERGHQFGDGVYEVIRVYNSMPFMADEHLERLMRSAEAVQIEPNQSLDQLKEIINQGIEISGLTDAEVYIQVTRGISPRQHHFPQCPASLSMTIRPVRLVSEELRRNGASVTLMDDERWANCYIKSLNLLPNVLAKQAAYSAGHYEAVFIRDGLITEGSSSNVFVVKGQVVYTTPLSKKILSGITRQAVIGLCKELGIALEEKEMTTEFFMDSDEIFITSTTTELLPICSVDGQTIGDGKPGSITQRLYTAYQVLYKGTKNRQNRVIL